MSPVERHYQWRRIAAGEANVVIGPRSAVFAPLPRLGLIVQDEEHDNSFKQDNVPRYHARDVALHRSYLEQIYRSCGIGTHIAGKLATRADWPFIAWPRCRGVSTIGPCRSHDD